MLYYLFQVDVKNILWSSWYSSDHWRRDQTSQGVYVCVHQVIVQYVIP